MPVTHSPFGWPRSGVCPSRPGRCSQAPRRPRPRTGCTCASSAARRRPAPLNCPWKEKTYGHQLEGPHEAAGVLAGHRGRGGDTGARVPGTRLRGHSTRYGRPAARPTQLGTRSERKFGAGGPRRVSTWQWLLRWGGIIMNGWPASRGGCCKGSAWEQMQYCVRTFC